MKVLFCINQLSGGGAEKVLLQLVNHLDPAKYQVTVLAFLDGGVFQKRLAPFVHYRAMIKVKHPFIRRILSDFISYCVPARLLYRLAVREKADVEVAFLEGLPTKMMAASANRKAKKIAWVHVDLMKFYASRKVFLSYRRNQACYQAFHTIACVSKDVRNAFSERFPAVCKEKITVVYNVIDEKEIAEKSRLSSSFEGKILCRPCAVSVGRLTAQKGYDRLLNVHKRLKDEGCFYTLWIIGTGTEQAQLESFIIQNGLSDSVKLWGFQENPYCLMAQADFFVCSSRAEGFSTVATEAVLLGLPVVTTDCAGMHELLDPVGCGIITQNSEEGLYAGIKKMLTDNDLLENLRKKARSGNKNIALSSRMEAIEGVLQHE